MMFFASLLILIVSPSPVWCLGNQLFLISSQKTSWNQAVATCDSLGYKILDVTTEAIQNTLLQFSVEKDWEMTITSSIWVGLHTYPNSNGEYFWGDCSPLTWSYWNNNEPMDSETRMCTVLELGTLRWLTLSCSNAQSNLVCVKDMGDCQFDTDQLKRCTESGLSVMTMTSGGILQCQEQCQTAMVNNMECWLYEWSSYTRGCTLHFHTDPFFCDNSLAFSLTSAVGRRVCFNFETRALTIADAGPDTLPQLDCGQQTISSQMTNQGSPLASIQTSSSQLIATQSPLSVATSEQPTSLSAIMSEPSPTCLLSVSQTLSVTEYQIDPSTTKFVSQESAIKTWLFTMISVSHGTKYSSIILEPSQSDLQSESETSTSTTVEKSSSSMESLGQVSTFDLLTTTMYMLQNNRASVTILESSVLPQQSSSLTYHPSTSETSLIASSFQTSATGSTSSEAPSTPVSSPATIESLPQSSLLTTSSVPLMVTQSIVNSAMTKNCSSRNCICMFSKNTSLENLKIFLEDLLMDVHKLSSYRRKKKSEADERTSAVCLGMTGIVLLSLTLLLVVFSDTLTIRCSSRRHHWNV